MSVIKGYRNGSSRGSRITFAKKSRPSFVNLQHNYVLRGGGYL